MKARHSKVRTIAFVALLIICVLVSIPALAIGWSFDYFGWHSKARWIVKASEYKARVMSEPLGHDASLRHVEWDGWGFPGAGDTVLYLVFDPNEQLLPASKTGMPGKYPGIPCEVVRVRRLERNWYIVRFYTEQDWKNCK